MKTYYSLTRTLLLLGVFTLLATWPAKSQGFTSVTSLSSLTVSQTTGEKPQSKVWTYAGRWWMVMPNSSGTHVWRLDGTSWTNVLTLSAATNTAADCKVSGNLTHILLFQGTTSYLFSIEYVPASTTYQAWTTRPSAVTLTLDANVETATIDIDNNGRMWLASDETDEIFIRYSDSPYSTWSSPIQIAAGINSDDICAVAAFNGRIGVMWSNQNTDRFGFRYHVDGDSPSAWSADEVPASQSAQSIGGGMADDHMNLAVASDGTLYAAVKTSYNDGSSGNPQVALLIRRPAGTWDDLYSISTSSTTTRGIVVLNEAAGKVKVIYTSSESGGDILYRESSTSGISFGTVNTLITGGAYNNSTSTKQTYSGDVVIMATSGTSLGSVLASDAVPNLVAHWKMDESNGATTLSDATPYANNAAITGSPTFIPGVFGNSIQLSGTAQYAVAPHSSSLNISGPGTASAITLTAWIRPTNTTATTQNIIKKANTSGITDGFELSLGSSTSTWPQKVFFRINQLSSSDVYRVNSTTSYPLNGTAWMHIAATFDGTTMKLYVNGVQEGGDVTGPAAGIIANSLGVGIGAQPNGSSCFMGQIDDARIYNRALSAAEILELVTVPPPILISPVDGATGVAVNPTLTWSASPGASAYRVQVSADNTFATTVYDQSDITSTTAAVSGLSYSTVYYWRVSAFNAGSASGWSSVRSFSTISATPPVEDNGAGYALDFDGTNGGALTDYVNCGTGASLNITTSSLTIEAWIKPTVQRTHSIVKKFLTSGAVGYELFLANNASPNRYVSFRLNNSATYRVNSSTNYPIDGTWMHVAATYDYTAKTMKIFINGVEENSIAGPASIGTTTNPLTIGSELSDFSKGFRGMIDEVRVWNVARSDADIKTNMTKKLVGNETGLVGYWRFDETSGTLVNDETSNNNDGTMINMDPATDHVWSGASLGDESVYAYDAAGTTENGTILYSVDNDAMQITSTSASMTGVQIYYADDNPMRTGSTTNLPYHSLDPKRFWGVRTVGTSSPTFTMVYYYGYNTFANPEGGLQLVKRDSISDESWEVISGAVQDDVANTITVTGATSGEYALAALLPPTVTITGTPLSPFTSQPGVPSSEQSYIVSGYNLPGDLNILSPAGFEISTTSGSGWTSSITLPNAGGLIPATTIYVRFYYGSVGTVTDNIRHYGYMLPDQNVAVEGTSAYLSNITLSFQDGVNGYSGTRDTYTDNATGQTGPHGDATEMIQDINTGDERRSLLLFDLTSIPSGTIIQSAELQLYVNQEGQGFRMYQMLTGWNEATVSYSSLGNRHFAADGTDAETTVSANWPGVDGYTGYITVSIPAATIQNWINNPGTNHGWLMIASHPDDGQRERTREWTTIEQRPKLTLTCMVDPPTYELNSPLDNATDVPTYTYLQVTVSDPQYRPLSVSYYGRKAGTAGSNFTVVGLPDTQDYSASIDGGVPAMFNAQTSWIKNNRAASNIVFATHFGDVTNDNTVSQWQIADDAMSELEDGLNIPFGISIGNHDGAPGSTSNYNTYFGESRFTGRSYYGGHYGVDNDNNYELFSAGGMNFIIIHLEMDASAAVLDWADGVLKANSGRRAIVTTHSLIETGNPGSFNTNGIAIYEALKDNPNLFLMLCGHVPGVGRRSDIYNGNVIHTLLADYQGETNGGNGYMRILEFSPQNNNISVKTYSPYLGTWLADAGNEFTIPYAMGDEFKLIGTDNSGQSSYTSGIIWPSLENDREYEWYVTVSNGSNTVTSPVWSFTTGTYSKVWTGSSDSNWSNGANWNPEGAPGLGENITIPAVLNAPILSGDLDLLARMEIEPGGALTVTGNLNTTQGAVSIGSTTATSGSLIVQGTPTGNITYNRLLRAGNNFGDKHLFSSPVGGQTINGIITDNYAKIDSIRTWIEPDAVWREIQTGQFISGTGYNVYQTDLSDGSFSFTGPVVNSASVNATSPYAMSYQDRLSAYPTDPWGNTNHELTGMWASPRSWTNWGGGAWNLLGNPFTSALRITDEDADLLNDFLNVNEYSFDPSYVAVYIYNGPGMQYLYKGKSTGFEDPTIGEDPANVAFGYNEVPVGQGFLVLANYNEAPFNFTPAMQTHSRTVPITKSASTSDSWPGLQLKVRYGSKESRTIVFYHEGMTGGLDPGYDVGLFSSGSEVEIYTELAEKDNSVNFVRQGLPIDGANKIVIPVGIDSEKGGEVTFSAYTVPIGSNRFWLEDRLKNTFTDLTTGSYNVILPAKTYGAGRFYIISSVNTPTGTGQLQAEDSGVRIWTSNEKLIIKGEVSEKAICEVYDINGKLVLKQLLPDGNLNTLDLPQNLRGVFLVRVIDGNKVTSRKIAVL